MALEFGVEKIVQEYDSALDRKDERFTTEMMMFLKWHVKDMNW